MNVRSSRSGALMLWIMCLVNGATYGLAYPRDLFTDERTYTSMLERNYKPSDVALSASGVEKLTKVHRMPPLARSQVATVNTTSAGHLGHRRAVVCGGWCVAGIVVMMAALVSTFTSHPTPPQSRLETHLQLGYSNFAAPDRRTDFIIKVEDRYGNLVNAKDYVYLTFEADRGSIGRDKVDGTEWIVTLIPDDGKLDFSLNRKRPNDGGRVLVSPGLGLQRDSRLLTNQYSSVVDAVAGAGIESTAPVGQWRDVGVIDKISVRKGFLVQASEKVVSATSAYLKDSPNQSISWVIAQMAQAKVWYDNLKRKRTTETHYGITITVVNGGTDDIIAAVLSPTGAFLPATSVDIGNGYVDTIGRDGIIIFVPPGDTEANIHIHTASMAIPFSELEVITGGYGDDVGTVGYVTIQAAFNSELLAWECDATDGANVGWTVQAGASKQSWIVAY